MNTSEYTYLIHKPDAVNEQQTAVLEKIIQEFPYFQSARALCLKGLYNQNSFKYNYVLKVTAAHTADRSILFDFISSETFASVNKELFEHKLSGIGAISVNESQIVESPQGEAEQSAAKLEIRENTIEQSILSSIKEAEPKATEILEYETQNITLELPSEIIAATEVVFDKVAETETPPEPGKEPEIPAERATADTPAETALETKLEIGKPLAFSIGEKHSFEEWLQLSRIQPIQRAEGPTIHNNISEDNSFETDSEKQKKKELIDLFIETNPKIPAVKHDSPLLPSIIVEPSKADNSYLMTETLARVYLEQKKYHKAIQAYEILILKYPEKSSFFADRILDIKNLQQNNKQ